MRPQRGSHGYDPALESMHGMFVAAGPAFKQGVAVPAFENVHIYNALAAALGDHAGAERRRPRYRANVSPIDLPPSRRTRFAPAYLTWSPAIVRSLRIQGVVRGAHTKPAPGVRLEPDGWVPSLWRRL